MSSVFAIFGYPGPLELMVIGLVALLLFGNRLPSVMRNLGKGITEFKKGVQGVDEETDEPPKLEKETAEKPAEK